MPRGTPGGRQGSNRWCNGRAIASHQPTHRKWCHSDMEVAYQEQLDGQKEAPATVTERSCYLIDMAMRFTVPPLYYSPWIIGMDDWFVGSHCSQLMDLCVAAPSCGRFSMWRSGLCIILDYHLILYTTFLQLKLLEGFFQTGSKPTLVWKLICGGSLFRG